MWCIVARLPSCPRTALHRVQAYVFHHSRENVRRWRLCHADRVFRTLELLGGLSLVTDIGTGSPLEESLKRCLVAVRLSKIIGCTDEDVSDVLYTALLQHLGCTAYTHEGARVWGDDVVTTRVNFLSDSGELADMWRVWVPGMAQATGWSKARVLATTVVTAGRKEEATAVKR